MIFYNFIYLESKNFEMATEFKRQDDPFDFKKNNEKLKNYNITEKLVEKER